MWPEVQHWALRPCDPSYIRGTLPHPTKHKHTHIHRENGPWVRASDRKQSGWESGWLPPVITVEKRPHPPSHFAQITGPLLDAGPKQRRPCPSPPARHTLCLCIRALISSVVGQQVSLTQRYLNHSLCLSFLPSLHPQPRSPPCSAYIILITQNWLIRETLYGESSLMGSKGIWLVQNPGGKKLWLCWTAKENMFLRPETSFIQNRVMVVFKRKSVENTVSSLNCTHRWIKYLSLKLL